MVTNLDTSSRGRDIDINRLCIYTIKNIWLEKEKYLEKQKKPVSVLKLILMVKESTKLTLA
jgi:hypothetical protein